MPGFAGRSTGLVTGSSSNDRKYYSTDSAHSCAKRDVSGSCSGIDTAAVCTLHLSSFMGYFLTHLLFLDKIRHAPRYELDMQQLRTKSKEAFRIRSYRSPKSTSASSPTASRPPSSSTADSTSIAGIRYHATWWVSTTATS